MDALELVDKNSSELGALNLRIRECTNLSSLEERTAKQLSTWDEFDLTIAAVSDYCPQFPIILRVKVTFAYTIREMHRISEVVMQDSSDKSDLETSIASFMDCFLVHLGGDVWDGKQPTVAAMCLEAFKTLNGHVKDMEDGNAAEDSNLISEAAGSCGEILKAGLFTFLFQLCILVCSFFHLVAKQVKAGNKKASCWTTYFTTHTILYILYTSLCNYFTITMITVYCARLLTITILCYALLCSAMLCYAIYYAAIEPHTQSTCNMPYSHLSHIIHIEYWVVF